MPAHLWLPANGTGPGIVLFQEIFGISDYIVSRAEDLAALGYVVLAPEVYWRLGASRVENGPDAMSEAMGLAQRVDWDSAVADGVAAVQALSGLAEVRGGTGIVGFCFGGGLGFNVAARTDPAVLVSYYGSAIADLLELAADVTTPSLHHFGLADSYVPAETVARNEQVLTAQPGVEFLTYDGADHAFDNPDFPLYHPEASAEAWARTVTFLRAHLPVQ